MKRTMVVAITGASGVTYAVRLLEVLTAAGCDVYLTISAAAQNVLKQELDQIADRRTRAMPSREMRDG